MTERKRKKSNPIQSGRKQKKLMGKVDHQPMVPRFDAYALPRETFFLRFFYTPFCIHFFIQAHVAECLLKESDRIDQNRRRSITRLCKGFARHHREHLPEGGIFLFTPVLRNK